MTIELDEQQQAAVDMMADSHTRIGILTGGPGRGKTTCLREALKALRAKGQRVSLAAPTGKAARRMSEATQYPASTLHRLLGLTAPDCAPTRPPEGDVIVVDEASMIDTYLASALFSAIDPRWQRVFFVGDADQLPSVGPGYILGDLIAGGHVPVVELVKLHRAAADSWVARNAPRILAGDYEHLELGAAADFRFVRTGGGGAQAAEALLSVLEDELTRVADITGAVDIQEAFEGLQVLIPMKKGPVGVETVNQELQQLVQGDYARPHDGYRLSDDRGYFWSGDKILHTRNNYQLQVMNGETGTVTGILSGKKGFSVRFDDGREVDYGKKDAYDAQLGYATTIHKSQGSEWPVVVVVCHSAHQRMLGRQLIYTAVTRGKKRVVLVGDDRGIELTLRNDHVAHRSTALRQRLDAELAA